MAVARRLSVSIPVFLGVLLAGCDSCRRPAQPPPPHPAAATPWTAPAGGLTTIRIGYGLEDGEVVTGEIAEVFRRTDILERNGFRGEFLTAPNVKELDLGKTDVALVVPAKLYATIFRRRPFVIVAPLWRAGVNAIAAREDSKVRAMSDLRGQRIESVMTPGLLFGLLNSHDLEREDVHVIESFRTPDALLEDMKRARLDAATVWSPWLEHYEDRGEVRVLDGNLFGSLVLMSRELLQRPDGSAVRFGKALLEAVAFLKDSPDLAHGWYAQRSGIAYRVVRQAERSANLYKRAVPAPEDLLKDWDASVSYLQGPLVDYFSKPRFFENLPPDPTAATRRPLEHETMPDLEEFLAPQVLREARAQLAAAGRPEVRVVVPEPESDAARLRAWLESEAQGDRLRALEEITRHSRRGFDAEVRALLADSDPEVRASAAYAAGRLKLSGVEASLEGLLEDATTIVRVCAIEAAARIDAARFKPALLRQLAHRAPAVRAVAVQNIAASFANDPAALDQLMPLLDDADPRVRLETAWCLAESAPDEQRARAVAERALKKHRPLQLEYQVPLMLAGRFPSASPDLPWAAWTAGMPRKVGLLRMISDLPPDQAMAILAPMAASPAPGNRIHALWAMVRVYRRSPDAARPTLQPVLASALADTQPEVRRAALELVGSARIDFGAARAVEALADADPEVRVSACYAVAELGLVGAMAPLRARLGDRISLVRATAIRGLAKLGGKEVLAELEPLTRDPDASVAAAAQAGVAQLQAK